MSAPAPLTLGELRMLEDFLAAGAATVDASTVRRLLATATAAQEARRAAEEREDAAWGLLCADMRLTTDPERSP